MKKIIFILGVAIAIGGIVLGVTNAYFADTEISENNNLASGTFDIDDEGTWTKSYSMTNIYPGKDAEEINFTLRNMGSLPMRVWMTIKNVSNEDNGISDSERDWYDDENSSNPKNDVDSVMVYSLNVDGSLALEQEAGITVGQIKDYYINLVKTDQPFLPSNGDGILYPGDTIQIDQKFYLPPETENWAQSDVMSFEIEILAQQVDAQEPIKQLSFMQNKDDTGFETDGVTGVLKYDSYAEEFNYDFIGRGLIPGTNYNLVYSPDPWEKLRRVLSNIMVADEDGKIDIFGQSVDIGDLPVDGGDDNYPYGAKIWLVTSTQLTSKIAGENSTLTWANNDKWLLDNWPGLIRYEKNANSATQTITVNEDGGERDNQYGYQFDYTSADVNITYNTVQSGNKFTGTISAVGLKPYATYQVKFIGKPICAGGGGNDVANENIGYKGRWTCVDCSCSGSDCNRNDSDYQNYSYYRGNSSQCIAGYLVWDYFTADENGNIYTTETSLSSDTSYHVLRCAGGVCGTGGDAYLDYLDSSHPTVKFCPHQQVNGEIQSGKGGCDGLSLDSGSYDLRVVLTEESFHEGNWATVSEGSIDFEIE